MPAACSLGVLLSSAFTRRRLCELLAAQKATVGLNRGAVPVC